MSIRKLIKKIILFKNYVADFNNFRKMSNSGTDRFSLSWVDRYPCLNDKTKETGFDRHYIYHTAWAARIVAQTSPQHHIDISSSLYFSSIVSAFVPVKFYDYRRADMQLANLTTESADLLALPFASDSIKSLSCMHVVEHIGLGRYGDQLDPEGDLKAIAELKRVIAEGGSLLFVVPIGRPKIMFNAHRIYSYDQIADYFKDMHLEAFALIPDNPSDGGLIEQASKDMADAQKYGCGCFWFKKP